MRSLIELFDGTIDSNGFGPTMDTKYRAARLFGTVGRMQQPSRLIVRDCNLMTDIDKFKKSDLAYAESKTEVVINRITAEAKPRTFERVPAGAEFELNMVLNVFDEDNEKELVETVKQALKLLEDDYLGGHGSRGYGQVKFMDLEFEHKDLNAYSK